MHAVRQLGGEEPGGEGAAQTDAGMLKLHCRQHAQSGMAASASVQSIAVWRQQRVPHPHPHAPTHLTTNRPALPCPALPCPHPPSPAHPPIMMMPSVCGSFTNFSRQSTKLVPATWTRGWAAGQGEGKAMNAHVCWKRLCICMSSRSSSWGRLQWQWPPVASALARHLVAQPAALSLLLALYSGGTAAHVPPPLLTVEGVAANAHHRALPQPLGGGLEHGLVRQCACTRPGGLGSCWVDGLGCWKYGWGEVGIHQGVRRGAALGASAWCSWMEAVLGSVPHSVGQVA